VNGSSLTLAPEGIVKGLVPGPIAPEKGGQGKPTCLWPTETKVGTTRNKFGWGDDQSTKTKYDRSRSGAEKNRIGAALSCDWKTTA